MCLSGIKSIGIALFLTSAGSSMYYFDDLKKASSNLTPLWNPGSPDVNPETGVGADVINPL